MDTNGTLSWLQSSSHQQLQGNIDIASAQSMTTTHTPTFSPAGMRMVLYMKAQLEDAERKLLLQTAVFWAVNQMPSAHNCS